MALKIVRRVDIPIRGGIYPYVKLSKHGLYFTVACVNKLNLEHDGYIMFLNDGKHWEFTKTIDTQEFRLRRNGNNPGLWIMSVGLAAMITKSMQVKPNQNLYIIETSRMLKEQQIIILQPNKPL